MKAITIVAMCTLGAIVYGIVHDFVTARICVEYFTIGHPRIIESESPARLALAWGVLATLWVGAGLGVLWAFAARATSRPKIAPGRMILPLAVVMGVSALAALALGVLGRELAAHQIVELRGDIARAVPADRHVRFITCLWAHGASYAAAVFGALAVALWTWRARGRARQLS